ncbi:hypothetical protein B0H13DRAFT_1913837 [Mycena leptocephala]|nr:hypothetical protein B0H13DRAFT_1913837 [Mycena leptocephala]
MYRTAPAEILLDGSVAELAIKLVLEDIGPRIGSLSSLRAAGGNITMSTLHVGQPSMPLTDFRCMSLRVNASCKPPDSESRIPQGVIHFIGTTVKLWRAVTSQSVLETSTPVHEHSGRDSHDRLALETIQRISNIYGVQSNWSLTVRAFAYRKFHPEADARESWMHNEGEENGELGERTDNQCASLHVFRERNARNEAGV